MQEKDAQEKLDNDAKDLSKVSQKQSLLRQKVEECTNKISELGAIPNPEMISKYMAYTQKSVSSDVVWSMLSFMCKDLFIIAAI